MHPTGSNIGNKAFHQVAVGITGPLPPQSETRADKGGVQLKAVGAVFRPHQYHTESSHLVLEPMAQGSPVSP
jgi:hypothetical protein